MRPCERRIRFAQPRRPLPGAPKMSGGNCPPRTPMGPEPLCLSGERAEGARRADRSEHTGGLPRFGPRWTRKTLLLLSLYWVGELGSLKNQLHRACERSRFRTPNPPYVAHGPPFIVQGVTDRCQRRRKGKNVKGVVVVTVREQWSHSA